MRTALLTISMLSLLALLGQLLLNPAPASSTAGSLPLLSPRALGEKQESSLTGTERAELLERQLQQAFPTGGRPVRNRFGRESEAYTPAFGSFPELRAPLEFRAHEQEGGVRLVWKPHPNNPVQGLRYRLERWGPQGSLEAQWVVDRLEWVDEIPCENAPYAYRVSAELEKELELGSTLQTLARRSPSARISIRLERKTEFEAELDSDLRLWLTLKRRGLPDRGPFEAVPGKALGETQWFVESWTKGETEVDILARSPRFDALGRRIIVDGQPANRVREESELRAFVTLSLVDPCSQVLRETLILDQPPSDPSSDPAGEEAPR